jgi:hypothetical protein
MNLSQADLLYLKWSLLTFILTLVLGLSAVFIAKNYSASAQNSQRVTRQQLSDARKNLNAARDDAENMAIYTQEFSAIQKRDIIGEESRLTLIESLEALRQQNRVLDFKYTIAPQQPYKSVPVLESGNFDLLYSPMTLQIDLLHEGQLINLIDSMSRDMGGWFILEKCMLARNTIGAAQLQANCNGGWLTMKNRNAK